MLCGFLFVFSFLLPILPLPMPATPKPLVRSRNVPINITILAQTKVDREAVRKWLDEMGATDYEPPSPENVSDPALLVALAAKQCYMSFEPGLNPNVTKVRSDIVAYLDNILASGHGSVLEHATYTFGINGVSRVFTAEMNRHRAGWAISERSLRYIRFGDCIDWWLPTSLKVQDSDTKEERYRKEHTALAFHRMFTAQSRLYEHLVDLWELDHPTKDFKDKKAITSCLRRIIGMGCATGGVWTGNIRALRHVIAMRASSHAEEEILHVFSRVVKMLVESEPMLFGDFTETPDGFWIPKYPKV